MIHWEQYKRLNFDDITKCYKHKAESVQENISHKILWDFEIQTENLILARHGDNLYKKRTCRQVDFFLVEDGMKIKESEKKYLDVAREI